MIFMRAFIFSLVAGTLQLAAQAQWVEPDDVREYARVALVDFDTPVSLSSDGDVDWYRLAVARATVLTIVDTENTSSSLQFTVVDSDGEIVELDAASNGYLVGMGIYFISVQGPASETPYTTRFSLTNLRGLSRLGLADDEQPVAEGTWPIWSGYSDAPLEFTLSLDELSMFQADISYQAETPIPYYLRLIDEDGTEWPQAAFMTLPQAFAGQAKQRVNYHLPPGDYTVALYRDQVAEDEAEITFSSAPPNDGFEPNDSGEFARLISANQTGIRIRQFPSDPDWFYFDIETGGALIMEGMPGEDTSWDDIYWPDILQDAPDGPGMSYNYSEATLARYPLEAGRYFIRANPNSYKSVDWTIDLEFTSFLPSDASGDNNTRFYMMGLEPGESLTETIASVAAAGGGESIPVSSDDMELGLTLARIVGASRQGGMTLLGYAKATAQVMNQRLFIEDRPEFSPKIWIGTGFLAEAGVFTPYDPAEPDLALSMRDVFKTTILSPFNSREDDDG